MLQCRQTSKLNMAQLPITNCLPPNLHSTFVYGHLKITALSLTFFSQPYSNVLIKLSFWGAAQPVYIPINSTQTFELKAPNQALKQYLIDCKVTQFAIVDSRNYKPIAHAYLNWLSYMRPLGDQKIYSEKSNSQREDSLKYKLPFIDEEMFARLPLSNYLTQTSSKRRENIGQLEIKWECRVYEANKSKEASRSSVNFEKNSNIRRSEGSSKFQYLAPISYDHIDMSREESKSIQEHQMTNKNIMNNNSKMLTPYYGNSKTSLLLNEEHVRKHSGHRGMGDEEAPHKLYEPLRTQTNNIDLELLRIKFDMEELVGRSQKTETLTMQIIHFQCVSKQFNAKDFAIMDINCDNKQQKNHWKIYSQGQVDGKVMFNYSIGVTPGSILTFSMNLKKPKEVVLKGQVTFQFVTESYDLSIISSQGTLVGFIRLKANRQSKVEKTIQKNIARQLASPKLIENQVNQQKQMINQIDRTQLQTFKKNKIAQPLERDNLQAYFLVHLNQETNFVDGLGYQILNLPVPISMHQKFIFVPEYEAVGKTISIQAFKGDLSIYKDNFKLIQKPALSKDNLTCALIWQKYIHQLGVTCRLWAGTIQQINYLIQQLPSRESAKYTVKEKLETIPNDVPYSQILGQEKQARLRKLKTEGMGEGEERARLMTEGKVSQKSEVDRFELQRDANDVASSSNHQDEENIYLVQLLTRFLEGLTSSTLPSSEQMPKEEFLQFINSQKHFTPMQHELIEIISSIFVGDEENTMNVNLVRQSKNAFESFMGLYREQKSTIIKTILEEEPLAAKKIKANAEMGTINQSLLWGKALKKVINQPIRHKFNKLYRISAFASTEAEPLIHDLQNISEVKLRSIDISNLSMLIRQWAEQYITRLEESSFNSLRQYITEVGDEDSCLNIRSVLELFQSCVSLRLSLWESLMMIQDVKACYNCDYEQEEGIITTGSLLMWVDVVRNRAEQSMSKSAKDKFDAEQLALINRINLANNEQLERKQRQISKESKDNSQIAFNNDSEIADIANLLRQREQMFGQDSSRVKDLPYKAEFYQNQIQSKKEKDPQTKLLENRMIQKPTNLEDKKGEILSKQTETKKQINFSALAKKQYFLEIIQLKFYSPKTLPTLIKAIINTGTQSIDQNDESYFYLSSDSQYSEANGQVIPVKINNASRGALSLQLQAHNQRIAHAFLPWQQIGQCLKNNRNTCKKTMVIYGQLGKILGKFIIKLTDIKTPSLLERATLQNKSMFLIISLQKVSPPNSASKLFVSVDQGQKKELEMGKNIALSLPEAIYRSVVHLGDQIGDLSCTILLEQLFLKNKIEASFPLINCANGTFAASLNLTMTLANKQSGPENNSLISRTKIDQNRIGINTNLQRTNNQQVCGNKTCFSYFLNEIVSLTYGQGFNANMRIHCIALKENDQHQKLVLTSPSFKMRVDNMINRHSFVHQQIELENQQTYLQFNLLDGGKIIAKSEPIKIGAIENSLTTIFITLSSIHLSKCGFTVGIKKIKMPKDCISYRRISECMANLPPFTVYSQLRQYINKCKLKHSFTVKESQTLKQILENNTKKQQSLLITINKSIIHITRLVDALKEKYFPKNIIQNITAQLLQADYSTHSQIRGTVGKHYLIQILSQQTNLISYEYFKYFEQMIFHRCTKLSQSSENNQYQDEEQIGYIWIVLLMLQTVNCDGQKPIQKKRLLNQIDNIYSQLHERFALLD